MRRDHKSLPYGSSAVRFGVFFAAAVVAGQGIVRGAEDPLPVPFSSIGKESLALNSGKEAEILNHEGGGCLTHMWFGGDWPGYERSRIRVYVDGEAAASIDMEMGMGHGMGFPDDSGPWGTERMGRTGKPSGIYNTYRIPFGTRVRVTVERAKDAPQSTPFWWIVRGSDNLGVSLGGVKLPGSARLKLHKIESKRARPMEEFNLCDVKTAGALYQVTIAAKGLRDSDDWKSWSFLEACMRAYLDGSDKPTLLSSGLEDYFLGTYYFNKGKYANGLAGLTHFDAKDHSFSAYRFHDADPLFFRSGLRLTCRCGETEDGSLAGKMKADPPETIYTTYAWVYEWPRSIQ